MPEPTVHVLGLPHTETVAEEYAFCAYTQKVRRFCDMLTSLGRRVVLYAGTRNEGAVAEHVELVSDGDREKWFGDWDRRWPWDGFDVRSPWWVAFNRRAVGAIKERAAPGDFLGLIAGLCQRPVADALPGLLAVEWGVGYEGIGLPFCAYESEAWRHYLYGKLAIDDGRYFDAVIPNAYAPEEFTFRFRKDDYLLFLGRHTERKGTAVVAELAKRHRVVAAGQGEPIPGTEYVGVVGAKERAELLAGARAVLAPTSYVEPFGGVVVEALFSGTPAITSPWGAFTETVAQGVTGFRCHTLAEYLDAAESVDALSPDRCRVAACDYDVSVVAHEYDAWLDRLDTLHRAGWYEP